MVQFDGELQVLALARLEHRAVAARVSLGTSRAALLADVSHQNRASRLAGLVTRGVRQIDLALLLVVLAEPAELRVHEDRQIGGRIDERFSTWMEAVKNRRLAVIVGQQLSNSFITLDRHTWTHKTHTDRTDTHCR